VAKNESAQEISMAKNTDIKPKDVTIYFLPVETRVPVKFGPETLTSVTCARVCIRVEDGSGRSAEGWGETPLSVQWVWPGHLPYEERHTALKEFTLALGRAWKDFDETGHPMEIGHAFQEKALPRLHEEMNSKRGSGEPMPWLAALVCCSAFDVALHDAFGMLHQKPVYETYNREFMNLDLSRFLEDAEGGRGSFSGKYPSDFFSEPPGEIPAWHLVGGKDLLYPSELTGNEPDDGYPVLLADWIRRDGLKCLKVKLTGTDPAWDYDRLVHVGEIGVENGADWLTADFNCTVIDPAYVNHILDRLLLEHPRFYGMLLYVEQPFAYDLEKNQIDVHSVSARKPLFMDESAHDWRLVRLGRELGWTGVALKTCKTQTGALLSLCWARKLTASDQLASGPADVSQILQPRPIGHCVSQIVVSAHKIPKQFPLLPIYDQLHIQGGKHLHAAAKRAVGFCVCYRRNASPGPDGPRRLFLRKCKKPLGFQALHQIHAFPGFEPACGTLPIEQLADRVGQLEPADAGAVADNVPNQMQFFRCKCSTTKLLTVRFAHVLPPSSSFHSRRRRTCPVKNEHARRGSNFLNVVTSQLSRTAPNARITLNREGIFGFST
jgi:L-alanine-DL-glutamate epimerase-like enolase superfamily enzyme